MDKVHKRKNSWNSKVHMWTKLSLLFCLILYFFILGDSKSHIGQNFVIQRTLEGERPRTMGSWKVISTYIMYFSHCSRVFWTIEKIDLCYKSTRLFSRFGVFDYEHLIWRENMQSCDFLLYGMVGLWRTHFKKWILFTQASLSY